MNRTGKYREIKERLLQKESMQTLYNCDRTIFHNLIISIMENETEEEK